ncbi:MAG: hypothetical protein ACREV2_04005 [Burkholderiales bacterium]
MVQLYDKDTGAAVGTITEAQLQFLIDQLEEESREDTDYYLNRATLDILEEAGADRALMLVLHQALGDREEMEIRWSRS